ncbi:hypothetical protein [uncultured Dokdonia sp.]|uniref:hypothetical protein n=1 Tax=uncultured Dokdonia sp. TaxID=575653 RepID=UPI0026290ECB|nr:hypothetical protein [uncultured Dokdonia sp.]
MKRIFILLMMSAFIFACSKDDAVEEFQQDTDSLNLTNDGKAQAESTTQMLEFSSFDEMEGFIRELQESDADLLDVARSRSAENGYHSLLFIYDSDLATLDELGIKMEDVAIVHSYDDMLHLLLNKNGEVRVANQVFRVNGEFVYQYEQGASEQIAGFLENFNAGEIRIEKGDSQQISEELLVYRHNNNEDISEDLEREATTADNQRGVTHYDYFTGGQYRMRSRQFNGYWWFYSNLGFSTKVQKRKRYWFFGWRYYWGTVKKYNRLNYEINYTGNGVGYPSYTNSAQGFRYCFCNIARRTVDWSVGVPAAPFYYTINSGQSVHWAHEFSVSPDTEHRTITY